jgi:hypothetical protein
MEDANIFILSYILASVPRRLIHDHNNPVFLKVLGAFREEYFHCIGVSIGKNERKGFAVMGTYGTEYMGVFPYDVSRHHRSYPFWSLSNEQAPIFFQIGLRPRTGVSPALYPL